MNHSQHVQQFKYDSSEIRIYPIHEGKDGMVKKTKKKENAHAQVKPNPLSVLR